jgi:hypothetical protein
MLCICYNVLPAAGAHILYKKGPTSALQHGRVIRTQGQSAIITTMTSTAEAFANQLAPYLPSGSEVMLRARSDTGGYGGTGKGMLKGLGGGGTVPATVLHDNSESSWPPQYTVRLPDASTAVVGQRDFTAVRLPGNGPARPAAGGTGASGVADELPSVAPTLPGTLHLSYI